MTTEQTIDTTEGQKVNVDPIVSRIVHGDLINCPVCGAPGRFDDMKHTPDGYAVFKDAVFQNSKINNQWECYECWLK